MTLASRNIQMLLLAILLMTAAAVMSSYIGF